MEKPYLLFFFGTYFRDTIRYKKREGQSTLSLFVIKINKPKKMKNHNTPNTLSIKLSYNKYIIIVLYRQGGSKNIFRY